MTNGGPNDIESGEAPIIDALRHRGGCPAPELLLPARERTVPEPLGSRVRAHVAACPACRQLADALDKWTEEAPTAEERERLHITRAVQPRRARWRPVGLAAAVALAAGASWAVVQMMQGAKVSVPDAPAISFRRVTTPPVVDVPLRPPSIDLPAGALVLRGGAVDPYVSALSRALMPFREGRYDEAAARLGRISEAFPGRPHALFYRGVALMLAGRASQALPVLEQARAAAAPGSSFRAEASWYLAAALQRQGRREHAVAELILLCDVTGDREREACLALHHLLSPAWDNPGRQ